MLRSTGMSNPSVNRVLVAVQAIVNMNVDSHCLQDYGDSKKLHCQL